MNTLQVIHRSAKLHVKFSLARMIADWRTAQARFISGITEHFGGWHSIRPENFSTDTSASFADNHCACDIYGGACRIVLNPGEVSLTISNVTPSDHLSVGQILKRTWSWFIAESELGWSTYQSIEHPESHDAAAIDPYFNQFALAGVADAASRSDRDVRYQPAARVTLSDSDGYWVLRRLFQKTEMIPK